LLGGFIVSYEQCSKPRLVDDCRGLAAKQYIGDCHILGETLSTNHLPGMMILYDTIVCFLLLEGDGWHGSAAEHSGLLGGDTLPNNCRETQV